MITEEIRLNWKLGIIGNAREIASLKDTGYPAWCVKFPGEYGVAIPYSGETSVNENFAHARICNTTISFNGSSQKNVLLLVSDSVGIELPFSSLCAEFVDPGINGVFRKEIESSPVGWWSEWKELLGNRNIDDRIYDVLGELCVLAYFEKLGCSPEWNGPTGASYDIEMSEEFVEVKSTLSSTKKEITISNLFQLDPPGKKLSLVLCQFEPSVEAGVSINSVVADLESQGFNVSTLNEKLIHQGFAPGKSARNKRFILHTMLKYAVDSDFPRIVPSSFVTGSLPTGIMRITYTVNLDDLVPIVLEKGNTDDEIQND